MKSGRFVTGKFFYGSLMLYDIRLLITQKRKKMFQLLINY